MWGANARVHVLETKAWCCRLLYSQVATRHRAPATLWVAAVCTSDGQIRLGELLLILTYIHHLRGEYTMFKIIR